MNTLRELAEKATPGPWVRVTEGNASVEQAAQKLLWDLLLPLPDGIPPTTDMTYVRTGDDTKNVAFVGNGPRQTENGDFIAAASPDVILRLLDALEIIAAEYAGPDPRAIAIRRRDIARVALKAVSA